MVNDEVLKKPGANKLRTSVPEYDTLRPKLCYLPPPLLK